MSFSVTLLLTIGKDVGPTFNIYQCNNGNCDVMPFTQETIIYGQPFVISGIQEGTTSLKIESIGDCDNSVIIPIQNLPTPTPTPTVTPTQTLTPTFTVTPTQTLTLTPTVTPTQTLTPTFTPTQTITPTPEPTPEPITLYVSGYNGTCADFCVTNYNITLLKNSTADYFDIAPSDLVSDLPSAGFYAISNISTDTNTGPFKIVEVDSLGEVLSILTCSGGICVPI